MSALNSELKKVNVCSQFRKICSYPLRQRDPGDVDVRVKTMHTHLMPDTVSSLSIADSRTFSISELAREFGITPRALRFYEDKDMLHPARDGMTRVYSHRDRGRVKIIVRLKRLGLPLADIREILDLYGLEDGQRAQMRMSLVKFQNQIKELESQREDIEMALQELHRGIEWLEEQLDKIGPGAAEAENLKAYDEVARRQLDDA